MRSRGVGNGSVYRRGFAPRPPYPAGVFSIGLVLSAGGMLGDPWHTGVLARLAEVTGWDARRADLVIGTSAGAITGTALRTGITAADRAAHFRGEPMSPEAMEIAARIVTGYEEPEIEREWRPMSPGMSWRAAWPPWKIEPLRFVTGVLPRGTRSGESLEIRMNELVARRWPVDPMWVVAVRMHDGRRVVFGRDDIRGNIGQAVRASAAVPGVYVPTRIGQREYVDGGLHSSTNADLAAPLGFDLVLVSSAMTATPETRGWTQDPGRAWFGRKLDAEVAEIRRRGTAVVVFEPDAEALGGLSKHPDDARSRALWAGESTVDRVLRDHQGEALLELLARHT